MRLTEQLIFRFPFLNIDTSLPSSILVKFVVPSNSYQIVILIRFLSFSLHFLDAPLEYC